MRSSSATAYGNLRLINPISNKTTGITFLRNSSRAAQQAKCPGKIASLTPQGAVKMKAAGPFTEMSTQNPPNRTNNASYKRKH